MTEINIRSAGDYGRNKARLKLMWYIRSGAEGEICSTALHFCVRLG